MDLFPGGCGPIGSIRQCGIQQPSLTVVIWKLGVTMIGGEELSINEVMNKLKYPPKDISVDPRFISAICSSAVSSADLSIAFGYPSASYLDAQLNNSMLTWLNNDLKGSSFEPYVLLRVSVPSLSCLIASLTHFLHCRSKKHFTISELFKIHATEFQHNGKSVWWWLQNYGTQEMRDFVGVPSFSYFSFDWNLNGEVGALCDSSTRPCYPWWGLVITVGVAVVVLICIFVCCYCARALKKKAFREYLRSNSPSVNQNPYERLPS